MTILSWYLTIQWRNLSHWRLRLIESEAQDYRTQNHLKVNSATLLTDFLSLRRQIQAANDSFWWYLAQKMAKFELLATSGSSFKVKLEIFATKIKEMSITARCSGRRSLKPRGRVDNGLNWTLTNFRYQQIVQLDVIVIGDEQWLWFDDASIMKTMPEILWDDIWLIQIVHLIPTYSPSSRVAGKGSIW